MASTDVFHYTHHTGVIFSPNERVALATSLPLLATKAKRRQLVLWGKILGYKADYIIVQVFDDDLVAEPELYYTIDGGLNFTLLGTASSAFSALGSVVGRLNQLELEELKQYLLRNMKGAFMGDPSYEYRVSEDIAVAAAPASGRAIDDVVRGSLSLKESVRLALFVEEHDYQCRVAPRGAYYRVERNDALPQEVRHNAAFGGLALSAQEALTLRSYYHIREMNPYRRLLASHKRALFEKSALEKIAENPQLDAAFDSIVEDIPSGIWQLRYHAPENVVVGRNTRFVGSMFYHVPETGRFGTVYMGDGTLNVDVAFEI